VNIKNNPILLLLLLILQINFLNATQELDDFWKAWLDEVEPIITKTERSVFQSLQDDESRKRFQKNFWQVRDTTPGTPENEYRNEYYKLRRYAENRLDGAHSDRGRIYLILGKPAEVQNFSGSEVVVDCELWTYKAEGRSGLPPMMYLLFYKRDNLGDYKLYYPGYDSSLDILSTRYMRRSISTASAYKIIRKNFPELAKATLSVLPEEANIDFAGNINSSGQVIGQIYTLPERELEKTYLKNFTSPPGTVDISFTTKEIAGKALVSLTEKDGVKFLNYSLMPETIQTSVTEEGIETAHLVFNLRVEDNAGKTIYQQENEIHLRLDEAKKKAMLERKLTFNNFAPIIEGEYLISLTYSNKTSAEFFVFEQKITVSDQTLLCILGYELKKRKPDVLVPFSFDQHKVLFDPRFIFSREDSLEGLILSDEIPDLFLSSIDGESPAIKIQDVSKHGSLVIFRQRFDGFAPGNYDLIVKKAGTEVFRRTLSVLSFKVEKPLEIGRSATLSFQKELPFILGQEYLNSGQVDKAIKSFQKFPENLWNSSTLPVMARAFYIKKDYARVVELLERDDVIKNYSVLLLLGNASLKLKKLERAALYFEEIRKFGDTAETNKTLGAIYYTLGERDKAKIYWERAKKLEKKSENMSSTEKEKRSSV
jgi:GWxTD domain-containing protein